MPCTQVLDHLVRMKDIASDLRAPLNLLFLSLKLSLLLKTFLEFYVIETGLENSESILPVVQLRTCLCVFNNYSRRNMPYTNSGLHLVDILSAGTA